MAFDQPTRNRLSSFVSRARTLLTDEFTRQLQQDYGLDPKRGEVADVQTLAHLNDAQRETAQLLRDTLDHYLASASNHGTKARQDALDRIVREQAFTVLNRLCAVRMAEARGLVIESVGRGYQSRGFQLYARLAGTALGETGDAYRIYLFSLFDEFAVDLPVLFDRFSPQGRLFPRETTLLQLLEQINHPEIDPLWAEDETIGWIYQYFNSKEERKAMRDASQAPRNSRELAVRNQFFTPRYVVEFLTDNTLGRIWYEMTRGATALVDSCQYLVRRPNEIFLHENERAPAQDSPHDDLTQEELLQQPVYIPYRPLKDPRDLKMLDPACGSMHFGLYAFDLFEQIYDEAWDWEAEHGADTIVRSPGLPPLHASYTDKAAFLRDVPRLIIERNIHGIDIDPRAVQIAGLSLWLRAQRSWYAHGIKPQDRPQIRRSNVVCAEPMPGERALLDEFLHSLHENRLETLIRRVLNVPDNQRVRATPTMVNALNDLVRTVWQEMELAGEAGSLLKIEESLATAIAKGRDEWENKIPLFRVTEFSLTDEQPKTHYLKTVPGEETDFWNRAEALVLAALEEYATQAENGDSYQRRLFADDAAQGFAFIDLCRKRFDVVLMNPPFGLPTDTVFQYLTKYFPDTYVDIYGSFVARGISMSPNGIVGAITPRTFIAAKKMARWRENSLVNSLEMIADFGMGVMDDAMVRSCAYIIRGGNSYFTHILAIDSRVEDKEGKLHSTINGDRSNSNHYVSREFIRKLPTNKILYFVTSTLARLMSDSEKLEPKIATVRKGMTTFDDERYLRLRWEIRPASIGRGRGFDYFAKGGEYANYYTNIHLLVNRQNDGKELCETNRRVNGQTAQVRQGSDYYYRRGSQFTTRSKGFSARAIPDDCVMSSNAPMIVSMSKISTEYLLGWVNSRIIRAMIEMQSMADDFIPGTLKSLPWITPDSSTYDSVSKSTMRLIVLYRHLASVDETDPYFVSPVWNDLFAGIFSFQEASSLFLNDVYSDIRDIQQQVSKAIDNVYEYDSHSLGEDVLERDVTQEITHIAPSLIDVSNNLISYVVGCVLGRFDLRKEAASAHYPSKETLFDPIPACPPGMLQNAKGLPAIQADVPATYPLRISWPGILVDDDGHPQDIERRVREAVQVIWRDRADAIEQEAATILGVRSLREYFRKPTGFFDDHLKRYSKSRRVAPIYLPLSTPSGSYTLWLYYHRLTDQTLYTCVNDFVDPKLKQVADEANRLRQKTGRSNADERELERLSDLQHELTDFRADLLRIATFWKPNLNDGVQITAAPLWKLFRHNQWQKRLKETWEKLEAGEYDWAHLAYSIWPDRVREKCRTDKSLAIAHELEVVYVAPPASAKKKRGKATERVGEQEGFLNEA